MKINKSKTLAVTLTLMLALTALLATTQTVKAEDLPIYCFLTVNPNPIGVGQTISVNFWIDKVTPDASTGSGSRWEGITVKVVTPDGTTETKGTFTLDAVASGYTTYTPTTTGIYTFQMIFPGQHITGLSRGVPFDNTYAASSSAIVELTVQDEQVTHWSDIPLPTGFWTRPLNAELRGVASIASYWLGVGSAGPHGPRAYDYAGNFQPYGAAPDSAHVLWTQEIAFGGPVGGAYGDIPYYPGETYERKLQPPIIMQGRIYYNQRLGSSGWSGAICADLYTGEQIWYKEGVTLTMGQLLDIETPNQHGVIPYVWAVSGSTYSMYDAFSGEWILDLTGVPSGSLVVGSSGELLIYTLSGATNRMTLWNSTRAINPTIDTTWSWRPSSTGVDVSAGYMWNVSVTDVPGSQSITKINPDFIYARATHVSTPAAEVTDLAYDIRNGKEPVMLWMANRTYEGSIMNGPMNNPRVDPYYDPTNNAQYNPLDDGVYTIFVKEQMVWYGYSIKTGELLWGPTEPYDNAWGMYQPYADASMGFGNFYAGGYDGTVHCYNFLTGENLWNYFTGSSGFETPYGSYPFKDSALTVADGKVFAATNEHSPSTPFFHGWKLHAIDIATGQGVWNFSYLGLAPIIADGYAIALNYFDNQIYCFGVGPSETTVTASPKITSAGSSVMIEGTVTDQSPGATGVPAMSDDSMSAWMEYVYEQREIPATATGVKVLLTAIDSNGGVENIGTVTTDMGGMFKKMWTPQTAGEYTIVATFEGSDSYGGSFAETAVGVTTAPAASVTATPTQVPPTQAPTTPAPTVTTSPSPVAPPEKGTDTALYVGLSAVIIIAVIAAVALLLRRRK